MKHLFTVLFALFTFSILSAQANKNYDGVKPEIYTFSKSLVFSYTPFVSDLGGMPTSSLPYWDDDDFTKVNLVGLGFKLFVSNKVSLQFSLGYGLGSTTDEGSTSKMENTALVYGTYIGANYHLASLYNIAPYFGIGLDFGVTSAESRVSDSGTGNEISKDEYSSSSFGSGVHIGFDWYFSEGISLGGRYAVGIQTYSAPEYKSSDGSSFKEPSVIRYGTSVGSIILNVHF